MQAWSHPEQLGERIVGGEIDPSSLCKFLVGAAILSAVIGKLLPDEDGGAVFWFDIPFLDEALGVLCLAAGGVLNAMIFFKPLHWVGGTGSFRDTVIAGVYATGATYPAVTFLSGLLWLVHAKVPGGATLYLGLYLMRTLAVVHRIPSRRAYKVYAGVSLGVFAVTLGVLFVVL